MIMNMKVKNSAKKDLKLTQDSLEDMLRRIHPYLPKTPKEKPKEQEIWKPVDPRVIPSEVSKKANKNNS